MANALGYTNPPNQKMNNIRVQKIATKQPCPSSKVRELDCFKKLIKPF
jgi:hypothetical protein